MKRKHLFLIVIPYLLSGCGSQMGENLESMKIVREKAVVACIENGGVPIIGYWSGMVDSCQYPPAYIKKRIKRKKKG